MTNQKNIVVADDDESILDATRIILEDLGGYRVRILKRGDALLTLEGELPDLILLDLWMSGHNGEEVCRHLKSTEKTRHIPVILFSANRDLENITQSCGADDFIAKPFQVSDMLEKIQAFIG